MDFLMIFVTLGTNDKSFERLLKVIEQAIKDGVIQDRVIAQTGYTKFQSDVMEVFESISHDDFSKYLEEADIVITHGGVGTIMTALEQHKKILGAARLQEYGEHVNDHQIQILEQFDHDGYLIYMKDLNQFATYYQRIQDFKPNTFVHNTDVLIQYIEDFIG